MNTHGCVYLVISVHMQYDYVLHKCRVKARTHQLPCNFFKIRNFSQRWWRFRQPLFIFFFFPSLSAKMGPLTHSNVCKVCRRAHGQLPAPPAARWGEADARPSFHSRRGGPTSAVTQVGSGYCHGNRSCSEEGGKRAQGPRMPQPLQAVCVHGIQTPAGHTVGPQGRSQRPMA